MIPIRNIYYMLSYSFQILNEQGYKKVSTEEFHNVRELCTAILIKGVTKQLKKGLGREYIQSSDSLTVPRGKIDISETVKTMSIIRKKLWCTYNEFSVDSYFNRIIKTTINLLIKGDISKKHKRELKKLLVYFDDVGILDIYSIKWNVQFNKNNHTYIMLISICNLIIKGLLQTRSEGNVKLMDFFDERTMHKLYEKFILEYYRKEHPELKTRASQIAWQLDDDMNEMLPIMQTDIMLSKNNKILIIDAKYYSKSLQVQYDKKIVHSNNLYQIFTYVKNKEAELKESDHEVAGMLLYAKTDDNTHPDSDYSMSGNKISVKTLDLDCEFSMIASQLDEIANSFFNHNKEMT